MPGKGKNPDKIERQASYPLIISEIAGGLPEEGNAAQRPSIGHNGVHGWANNGIEEILKTLVRKYGRLVRKVIEVDCEVPQGPDDDVAQNTWIAVKDNLKEWIGKDEKGILNLIRAIARNKAADYWRDIRRQRIADCDEGFLKTLPSSTDKEPIVGDAARIELADLLEKARATLDARRAMIFNLRQIDGWPWKDICEQTGDGETRARELYDDAREQLQQKLKQAGVDFLAGTKPIARKKGGQRDRS